MSGLEGLLAGRVLGGRYRIEEVIGRGGMGAVYRATDERLGRQVAVKVITLAGMNDPETREKLRARFHREARAAAGLPHHPNVVPVYDFGTDEALGLDFLVMELLRGEDLATRLARHGAPPVETGIRILEEAARGVAVGHRAGLVHRDVKPGNVFLATGDHEREVEVRILDFGIAKLVEEDDTATALTQDGRVPHSPAFASPEQLRGLGRITPASDVFSLGAVAYLLLTGERPYTEEDRSRMALGRAVPAPSLRERNPAVPPQVEAVVQRALSYDPEDRFPDASSFAAALRGGPMEPPAPRSAVATPVAAVDDERTMLMDDRTLAAPAGRAAPPVRSPSEVRPQRPPRRPLPEEKSGAGRYVVWFLVLLLLGGAAGVVWWSLREDPPLAEQIPEAPDLGEVPIDESIDEEPEETQPELAAFINNRDGLNSYERGDYLAALDQFQRAVDLAPENAEYRRNLALTYLQLEMPAESAEQLERALRLDPTQVRAHVNLADARLLQGDTIGAMVALERFLGVNQDPRLQGIVERRLRTLRAAQETLPAPEVVDTSVLVTPEPAPIVETPVVPPVPPRR